MRGTVCKGLRKNIYGKGKEKKDKMRERDFRIVNNSGTLMDFGARRIYQQAKTKIRDFGVLNLVKKAKRGEIEGVTVKEPTA